MGVDNGGLPDTHAVFVHCSYCTEQLPGTPLQLTWSKESQEKEPLAEKEDKGGATVHAEAEEEVPVAEDGKGRALRPRRARRAAD